ncbi:hypothetical protein [Caballeronia sp. HLA56]
MSYAKKRPAIHADWISKTLAGQILGFTLGIIAGSLLIRFGPDSAVSARAQLAMWLVAPIWMGVASLCYLFRSGAQAWLWLGLSCATGVLPLVVEWLI